MDETKLCQRCDSERPIWFFARWASSRDHWCVDCVRSDPVGWKSQISRRRRLLKLYGLYLEDYDYLLAEHDGGCWVCERKLSGTNLHVDHCHDNGHVRGLLCTQCNTGTVGDDVELLQKRLEYLKAGTEPIIPDRREEEPWTRNWNEHPLYGRWQDLARFGGGRCEQFYTFEGFLMWAESTGWEPGRYLRRLNWALPVSPDNLTWVGDRREAVVADPRTTFIECWDERKHISDWLKDSRVKVGSASAYWYRVQHDWSVEEALSYAPGESTRGKGYYAFGKWKTLTEWSKTPHCVVTLNSLRSRVVQLGWDVEKAMITPSGTVRHEEEGHRTSGRRTLITAWGEEMKSIAEWADDPRCMVSYGTLVKRLRIGWEPERAISQPPDPRWQRKKGDANG